jgi:hypothetical protein
MAKTHKSAIDWWIQLLVVLPMLTGSVVIVMGLATAQDRLRTVGVLATAGYCLLLGLVILPIVYVVGDHGLTIRAGLIRLRVPWDRLVDIAPSSSVTSSPAMSLKRLDVRYTKLDGTAKHVLISPVDRPAFLNDCAAASPKHKVDGDKLVAA